MKKSFLLALMLLAGSVNAMAGKVGDVGIGIEVGALSSNAVSRVNGVEADGDIDTTYQAIRLGKYFDFGRLGVALGLVNKDSGTDGEYIGITYDYMFYNDSNLIPFVGVVATYSSNTWEGSGISIDHDGMQYGVEAGAVYDLSDKIELEIGARYLESSVDGDITVGGNTIELEVDSVVQYYIALNYKF